MDRDKVLDDLEQLQQDNLKHGFAGSNERELWLRESIADYIVKNIRTKRKYAIIDFRNMDFMQNEEGKINYYDTMAEARLTCAMYEFENVWVVELMYNYIEDNLEEI
jgi:hypothetical protein